MNANTQVVPMPTGAGGAAAGAGAGIGPRPAGAAPEQARPLRRDAERNRRMILGAAKAVFAHRGLDASLDEVAREAGLGVGTVYRRFPNREALIDALFDDLVASITHIADESLALPRAWDGLVHFTMSMLESQSRDKSLRDVLIARQNDLDEHGQEKRHVVRETVQPMLYTLVERAKQEGDLRPDVVPSDIGVLLVAAVSLLEFTAPVAPDGWRRHVAIILDGLRARPEADRAPLREAPLDDEQVDACMAGWKYGNRETPRQRAKPV
jgi:AcrR family transcriptional regulator